MPEYEDVIRYKVKIDPSDTRREVQQAVNAANAEQKAQGQARSAPTPTPGQTTSQISDASRLSQITQAFFRAQRLVPGHTGGGSIPNLLTSHSGFMSILHGLGLTPQGGATGQVINALRTGAFATRIAGGLGLGIAATAASGVAAGTAAAATGTTAATGAASLAGPIGIAAAALLLAVKKVKESTQIAIAGRNQAIAGAFNANPSQMIKGFYHAAGGMAQLAGPLAGGMMKKFTDGIERATDMLDKLAETGKRYNGQIAASAAELQVHQIQAQMRISNAMAPMLSQWNKLKTQITDFGSKITAIGGKIISAIATPFEKAGTWLLEKLNKALDWILKKLGIDLDAGGKGQLNNFLLGTQRSLNRIHRGAIGGQMRDLFGAGESHRAGRDIRNDIASLRQQEAHALEIMGNPNYSKAQQDAANQAYFIAQKQIEALQQRQKQLAGSQPAAGMPANQSNSPPAPLSQPGPGIQTPQRLPSATTPTGTMGHIDINQHVNLSAEMKLVHERKIHDAICAIRDKLIRGMGEARNESRLALAMANLAGAGGMI